MRSERAGLEDLLPPLPSFWKTTHVASVTNRFEEAAMEVAAWQLGPRALQAQFYDRGSGGLDPQRTFHQVVFTVAPCGTRRLRTAGRTRHAEGQNPARVRSDSAERRGAGIQPVACTSAGTGLEWPRPWPL